MASLYLDFSFNNIPLNEIIDICTDSLYNDNEINPKIPNNVSRNLLNVATRELLSYVNNE